MPIDVQTTGYVPGDACASFIENVSHDLIVHVSVHNVGTVAANIQPTPLRDGVTWISYDFHAARTICSGTSDRQSCPTATTSIGQLFSVGTVHAVFGVFEVSLPITHRTTIPLMSTIHHSKKRKSFFIVYVIK